MRQSPIDSSKHDLLDAAVELMGQAGRRGTVRVRGESMIPTLRPGHLIEADFSPDPPRLGNLLLFRQQGTLMIHRYLGPARNRDGRRGYRTRGDGSRVLDPVVYQEHVVGRGVAVKREEGWYSLAGGPARTYGALLALHDLFWTVVARCAGPPDRILAWFGLRRPLCRLAWAFDRRLLRMADGILFARLHTRIAAPARGETG